MSERIYDRIWHLSPFVNERTSYDELTIATSELLSFYEKQGRLDHDPFESSRNRKIDFPLDEVGAELDDATCIVTGGLGCVGSVLVQELLNFNVRQIIIIDKVKFEAVPSLESRVTYFHCDVGNFSLLEKIFSLYKPELVFHTAAQRDPGLAESHVCETVETNVMGTMNVVMACEESGSVKKCIFSSTGKASRYFTEEIYAATKKICECIFAAWSAKSKIKYAMVRFTHIIDNSLMCQELELSSKNDMYVTIHSPGKYVTAQNAKEAAYLMLNALLYAEQGVCNFLIVRNLEWPVESLEVALYFIKIYGKSVPLIFSGNPTGYNEKFFRGQLNWERPNDLNLLINVYECNRHFLINESGDTIISRILPCEQNALDHLFASLKDAEGEMETKTCLIEGLRKIVQGILKDVPKKQTADILTWGLDRSVLEASKTTINDFGAMIPLLVESLGKTEYFKMVEHLFCKELPEDIIVPE